jgi:hypothetical protein
MTAGLCAVVMETGSIRGFLYGTEPACAYDNWVSHLAEGSVAGFNIYAPWEIQNNDFGDYFIPTNHDLNNWGEVVDAFLALDLDGAQALIDQYAYPYTVVQFQDLDSGRVLYMLRETLNDDVDTNGTETTADDEIGSFDYGWGLYIYDPLPWRDIIITAPHPCDDYPSPVFALEAFLRLGARFLMISGAGREVAYHSPYNSNNQSISDPSREDQHPFNVAYQHSCDQIRGITGKTEFSLQIHSYDWNKYPSQPNVMLSAGNWRDWPALPIRDNSRARHDLINHTPFMVHPANSIGTHSEVDIQDFYCVYYNYDEPATYDHDGQIVTIPRNTELPGAEYNQQMLYTAQQNKYDVYSPFLHVEMDELPKCYDRTTENWMWFYGYDANTQTWDVGQRYSRFIEFFDPWLNSLNEVIDSMLVLDDGTGPTNPENLRLTDLFGTSVDLAWDRSFSYDFDSYVINLRWESGGNWYYQTLDRNTAPSLAWQNGNNANFTVDIDEELYYINIQARDKHGNYSPCSNEIKAWTIDSPFTDFTVTENNGSVTLNFEAVNGSYLGFNIYRAVGTEPQALLVSWRDDPSLLPNSQGIYSYNDLGLTNGAIYSYQVSAEYAYGLDIPYWPTLRASPFCEYTLTLANEGLNLSKTFYLGANPLATDGIDAYDEDQWNSQAALRFGTFLDPDNDYYIYYRDIRAAFDPGSSVKCWNLSYRCTNTSIPLTLTPDPGLVDTGADLLIYDVQHDQWHDLREGPYVFINDSNAWRELRFYWGKQLPKVIFAEGTDIYQWQDAQINLHCEIVNRHRVQSVDIYLREGDVSHLVQSGISPQITDIPYVPTEAFDNARLQVVLNLRNGGTLEFTSSARVHILPPNISYLHQPGYSLYSFPISSFSQLTTDLLGDAGNAWTLLPDGTWLPNTILNHWHGYLISHPQAFQLSLPAEMPLAPVITTISPGWNLVPNPYFRGIDLQDVKVSRNNIQYDYAQMVADTLLSPRIYVYGEEGLTLSDRIPPAQAFFIYNSGQEFLNLMFHPSYHSDTAIDWDDQWTLSLSVSDGFNTADAVQIGTADLSTAEFDPLYDLPKPPPFPQAPYRLALLDTDGQGQITRELQSEYRGLYPWYNLTDKVWNFRLEANAQAPLRFNLDTTELPDGYSVELYIDGNTYQLQNGQVLWFDPSSAGTLDGLIRIRSYTPERIASTDKGYPSAFPNPFHESTSIQLNLPKGTPVSAEVYNLRGQKVRDLFTGVLRDSATTLVWNGTDAQGAAVAKGIYFLRISSEGSVQVHKLARY